MTRVLDVQLCLIIYTNATIITGECMRRSGQNKLRGRQARPLYHMTAMPVIDMYDIWSWLQQEWHRLRPPGQHISRGHSEKSRLSSSLQVRFDVEHVIIRE